MKVFLEVDRGPAAGLRYQLESNAYRAIGRHEGEDVQATRVRIDERPLDAEDHAVVEAHLRRRARASEIGGSARRGAFVRGADILLDDEHTSRTHALVFLDEQGASLVDLGSTNGTFVNAQPVTDAELVDGDVVHIGGSRLILRVAP